MYLNCSLNIDSGVDLYSDNLDLDIGPNWDINVASNAMGCGEWVETRNPLFRTHERTMIIKVQYQVSTRASPLIHSN